ncbi:MAG: hypothetical protein E7282_02855 [Lachnospiraceae bacterium]|nr:hypothetical protein [Lachnospiraceae bacterium]
MKKKILAYELMGLIVWLVLDWSNLGRFSFYVDGIYLFLCILLPITLLCKDNELDGNNKWLNRFIDVLAIISIIVWAHQNMVNDSIYEKCLIYLAIVLIYIIARLLANKHIVKRNNMWELIALLGVLVILFSQIGIAEAKRGDSQQEISLDPSTYSKCKDLFEANRSDAYLVIDENDTSMYLRDIATDNTSYVTFSTTEEKDTFKAEKTIGNVTMPVLTGDVIFDDEQYQITYQPIVSAREMHESFDELTPYAIVAIEVWCLLLIGIGSLNEIKKKKTIN